MVDASATQRDLLALAEKINIGDATNVDPLAKHLQDLSEAVVGGSSADAWAAIDVHRLIEPRVIVERFSNRQARNRWITQLQWARNVLILFPLILTWIGVSLAIHAHAVLISVPEHKDAVGESFISLWQQGFKGYLGQQKLFGVLPWGQWFVPANIVIGDFVFLFTILLLTGIVIWLKREGHRKRTHDAVELRERLTQVLADASLCLATRRWKTPTNLVDHFDTAAHQLLQELQEERQRLAELANRREKEFADLGAFTSGVAGVTTDMLAAANTLKGTISYLIQGLQAFSEHYKDVPKQQQALLLSTNNAIQLLQASINLLGGIESRQARQEEALTSALTLMREAIAHIVESASDLKRYTEEYVEHQHTLFQNLQSEHELQHKIVVRMISATEGTGKALQEIDRSANSLHIMAVDLNKMRNQLVAFLNDMKVEIFSEMKEAADQISKSGASLTIAATNMEQASQTLSHTVSPLKKEATQPPTNNADDDFIAHSITAKLGGYQPPVQDGE